MLCPTCGHCISSNMWTLCWHYAWSNMWTLCWAQMVVIWSCVSTTAMNCVDIVYCPTCGHCILSNMWTIGHCTDCVDIVYDQTCGHCAELKWLWSGAGDTFHTWSHTDWQPQPRRPEYLIELIPHTMLQILPASIHWIYHHLRLHVLWGTIIVNKIHTRCSTFLHSLKDMYLNVQSSNM